VGFNASIIANNKKYKMNNEYATNTPNAIAKVIVLDERGENLKSQELAKKIEGWQLNGCSEICFLIGGADGHLEQTRNKANLVLSFGKLTLPHILMRAVLTEQIYRIQTIINGHPYHRE
jgi:23S rRNA (pseudouridine1915-N3)-methyltransferase